MLNSMNCGSDIPRHRSPDPKGPRCCYGSYFPNSYVVVTPHTETLHSATLDPLGHKWRSSNAWKTTRRCDDQIAKRRFSNRHTDPKSL